MAAFGEEAVFQVARQIDRPEARLLYLDQMCASDSELRARLDALLRAHDQEQSFLERPAGSAPDPETASFAPRADPPADGTIIAGRYKLLQQIGEGGMGTVYMAEQTQPVQRKVALKVIKPGMGSRQVIARFEAERQALAIMDHVNIARVFDAGTTQNGQPYFVMELVHGVPITKYCDDNHLTPRERLELFVPVCQAIQHAHQKGIIHRDVKPSNVMVTLYDGKPVPKVIDFGVAKATEQKLTERTLFSGYGTMVGTLEYMSPEQAEMSALGVDTRSDIYSLGVLLYELLTGSTPLTHKRLKEAAYGEILRMIREEEAPKPSTRLSDSGEALASISARRGTEPAKLSRLVRGELDWIVMKCLEKDRNRRYETANGFAADVQRYLSDEPVQACPPSASYRLRKFVRRNQWPVTAGAALAALLVLGTVGTSVGLARAIQAERTATAAAAAEGQQREEAEQQRDRARAAEKLATNRLLEVTKEKERATAAEKMAVASEADTKAYSEFLVKDVLAVARPKGERGGMGTGVTVKEALDAAVMNIEKRFHNRPRAEALARHDLGVTYRLMGDLDKSLEQLERAYDLRAKALGVDDADTLNTGNSLAVLYRSRGEFARAKLILVNTLSTCRRGLGEDHPNTLASMGNLGTHYSGQKQFVLAEPLLVKALEGRRRVLGEDHPNSLDSMVQLAVHYRAQYQDVKAEPLLTKALELQRRVLGEDHPDALISMGYLGMLYLDRGQSSKAEPLVAKALEVQRRILGEEHQETLRSATNLGKLLLAQGQPAKAELLYLKTLDAQRRVLGEEHPDTLRSMSTLGMVYRTQRRYAKAEPLYLKALDAQRRVQGTEDDSTLSTMNNLAVLYHAQGRHDKAEPLFLKTLEILRRVHGEESILMVDSMNNLAHLYREQRQYSKAEPHFVQVLAIRRRVLGEEHDNTLESWQRLCVLYYAQRRHQEAELGLVKVLEIRRRVRGEEAAETASAMNALAVVYQTQNRHDKAEPLYTKALEVNRQIFGESHIDTLTSMENLAALYKGQAQFAKAEPLLLASYEGWKKRADLDPLEKPRLKEALQCLVQLYKAWSKSEKAAEWQGRLSAVTNPNEPPPKKK